MSAHNTILGLNYGIVSTRIFRQKKIFLSLKKNGLVCTKCIRKTETVLTRIFCQQYMFFNCIYSILCYLFISYTYFVRKTGGLPR